MGAPGCDDAPLVNVPMGTNLKRVTFVYPYYENPQFLQKQIEGWLAYEKRDLIKFIVVDDGSPSRPASLAISAEARAMLDIHLYRIEVDVRWNWLAARNIGAKHAPDGWLLLTDMDHVADAAFIDSLLLGKHDPSIIYRPSRREHTGNKIHPHPNSWFMTRDMFWKIGGYDEACSGFYGTDGDYRRRCVRAAPIRIMTDELVRYEYVHDSSTTTYLRKQPMDAQVKKIIRSRGPGWKPKTLSFPYHKVQLALQHREEV